MHQAVVRLQRKKIRSGQKGDKKFERECGAGVLGGARLNSGGLQAGGVRGGSNSGVLRISRDAEGGGSSRSESCQEF